MRNCKKGYLFRPILFIYFFLQPLIHYSQQDSASHRFDELIKKSNSLLLENKPAEALEINKELVDVAERIGDDSKIAEAYVLMGNLFAKLNDHNKAIYYLNKSLGIYTATNNREGIEICNMNLGVSFNHLGENEKALQHFQKSLDLNLKTNNKVNRSNLYNNLAGVYYNRSDYKTALDFFIQSLELKKEIGDSAEIIDLNNNIGAVLMELEKYKEARPYLLDAYSGARRLKGKSHVLLSASYNLSELHEAEGDYKAALDYLDLYTDLNDSLTASQNAIRLSEIEAKYQNEKKEEQNKLLNESLKNKNLQMYLALAAILLLSVLAFFVYRNNRLKNKANQALEEKNRIILQKNYLVEEQHKNITDSITYAQRIQQAILPPDKLWHSILPQSFVFYQPKDILSGDFYWIEETKDHIFIAAADCTGHGVPGALMSVLNYNLLNKAVLEQGIFSAGGILDGVNAWLTDSLHQSFQEATVKDGMDVSLCVINKTTKQINYSGAFNSIYVVNDRSLQELFTDKQPVGAFMEDKVSPFTNKFYEIKEGDVIYMFTDGYTDQFGGPKGKKYKYKNLQNLLLQMNRMPFDIQKEMAAKEINTWRGNLQQVDDILLLGFRLV